MSTLVPSGSDEDRDVALFRVRADKRYEAQTGYDGSSVAHPDLVPVCHDVFDEALGVRRHQVDRPVYATAISVDRLTDVRALRGEVTPGGLRRNVALVVTYLDRWLDGEGRVEIEGSVEDTSAAEIARSQLWQWLRHPTVMSSGMEVSHAVIERLLAQELGALTYAHGLGSAHGRERLRLLELLFRRLVLSSVLPPFLTEVAYEYLEDGVRETALTD